MNVVQPTRLVARASISTVAPTSRSVARRRSLLTDRCQQPWKILSMSNDAPLARL